MMYDYVYYENTHGTLSMVCMLHKGLDDIDDTEKMGSLACTGP